MSNLEVIIFDCPHCLQDLRVARDQAGNRIDCPKCNRSLTVPSQSADGGFVDDLFDTPPTDVYGVKCHVCDTRIHVSPKQIGTEVECPICYSKVKVNAPKQHRKGETTSRSTKSHIVPDEELKLSPPVERPKVEIDPAWGLAPVQDDLLAPKPKTYDELGQHQPKNTPTSFDDVPELIVVDDGQGNGVTGAASVVGQPKQATQKKSAKKSAKKQGQKVDSDNFDTTPAKRKTDSKYSRPEQHFDSNGPKDFPDFDLPTLLDSAIEMIKSPGVFLRVGVAFGLMCLGAISMEWIAPAYHSFEEATERSMLTRLMSSARWLVAAAIYLAGLGVLWMTSGFLFRDAARGKANVTSWGTLGSNEVLPTVLLFGFGFFMGGLPAAMFSLAILPLRILLSPLFLLSAWYSQSPFAIVSVDAFQSTSESVSQWKKFYLFASGLAFLGFVAGLIFWMRAFLPFFLGLPVIILAIGICVIVTLLFAPVCGWHCGRLVESLENPDQLENRD